MKNYSLSIGKRLFMFINVLSLIVFYSHGYAESFQKNITASVHIPKSGQVTSIMNIQDISSTSVVSDVDLYVSVEHSGVASLAITLSSGAMSVSFNLSTTETPYELQRMNIPDFSGEYVQGEWTLHVSNQSDLYTATIQSWSMHFDYEPDIIILDVQANIQNVKLLTDNNSNEFYEEYTFDIAIHSIESNANYLTAYARIYCPVIDHVFHVDEPVYITPAHTVNIVRSFSDLDFLGKVESSLNLSFQIELWDATGENLLADQINVLGENIPVEGIPFPKFEMSARFDGEIQYKTDADENGYFETFRFQIAFDPDVMPEISASSVIYHQAKTNLKVIIAKDQQKNIILNSWWHEDMIIIDGNDQFDELIVLDEKNFAAFLQGPSDIYIFLEIWDINQTVCLVSSMVGNQKLKLDQIDILSSNCDVSGNSTHINYHTDVDNDGYYEAFSFDLTMDGELKMSDEPGALTIKAASVYGKAVCSSQQETDFFWAVEPLVIQNATIDHTFYLTEKSLSQLISDNTLINCHVEIWDTTQTNLLASSVATPITIMADLGPDIPDFSITAQIENIDYMTDADNDQFYESFSFRIAVDGDVLPDSNNFYSANVYPKVVCSSINQSFFLDAPWVINGAQKEYQYIEVSEKQFSGIQENMSLLFEVELWDINKQYRLASTRLTEKINADVIPVEKISHIICVLQVLSGVDVNQSCTQIFDNAQITMADALTIFNNITSR